MKSNSIFNFTGIARAWPPLVWGLSLFLFLPIIALIGLGAGGETENFNHLQRTVLPIYIKNSCFLLLGVCALSLLWGVPSAWLISRFEFPMRRIFRFALLLPLALPSYLVAFVYTGLFDYAGPIQSSLRHLFNWHNAQDYWFFDIRSMAGAILVLSLVFSPYVYWLVSLNFREQSQNQIHAARLLGASEWRIFWRIILPAARPAVAVACTLVGMETLADYGTVAYFSVWHMTTAIYDTWLRLHDLALAAKLSCILLLFIVILISAEKYSRRHLRPYSEQHDPLLRQPLHGWTALLAWLWCSMIWLLAFGIPAYWLLSQAWQHFADTDWETFTRMILDTLTVAVSVASIATLTAFLLQGYQRAEGQAGHWAIRISSLGYAVPGTVLAIGVLIISTRIDFWLNDLSLLFSGKKVGLLVSGTLIATGIAFYCRFAAVGTGSVETAFTKIPKSYDQSAALCGHNTLSIAQKIWIPLIHRGLLTAFLLVFLESMKELSAALLLRPFNINLLSTYIYQYMSSERFEQAAFPALLLVAIGLPPVILLTTAMERRT